MKLEPIGCPETLVNNYQHAVYHLKRGSASIQGNGSLKSGNLIVFNPQLLIASDMLVYQRSE
jgi:hypothetical protein